MCVQWVFNFEASGLLTGLHNEAEACRDHDCIPHASESQLDS